MISWVFFPFHLVTADKVDYFIIGLSEEKTQHPHPDPPSPQTPHQNPQPSCPSLCNTCK